MRFCTLAAIALLAASSARGQIYHITDLGDYSGGRDESQANSINASGQITGYAYNTAGYRSFLWTPDVPNGIAGMMTDIGDLPGGPDRTAAYGINDAGQIVGYVNRPNNRPFLWTPNIRNGSSGSMIDLGVLPSEERGISFALNNYGQSVGYSASGLQRAFLWTPTTANTSTGSLTDLGTLSSYESWSAAYGINEYGQVVGQSWPLSVGRAFLWTPLTPNGTDGSMQPVGDLPGGSDHSSAAAINASGQVVGYASASTGWRAFLWTADVPHGTTGSMIDLGDLAGGSDNSYAAALNDLGQVVGVSNTGSGDHAFIWDAIGGLHDLNSLLDATGLNWTLNEVNGINLYGQIVGAGLFDPDGDGPTAAVSHAYLLTPVPGPGIGILIAGFCAALIPRNLRPRS